jgi:hypothetical protein
MTRIALLLALLTCAGCARSADPTPADPFAGLRATGARDLPPSEPFEEGRPGPNDGTIFDPLSARIEPATAYRYSLGHCGLFSPVDLDGSFWDPIDGVTSDGAPLDFDADGEMINATAGVVVVIGPEARFRTESGAIVRFARHEGAKEFPGCD